MLVNNEHDSYDIDKLYFELLPITEKIYKKYEYVEISNEEFKVLSISAIKICVNNLNCGLFIIEYQKQLNSLIKMYIKKLMEQPKKLKLIVNEYINRNLDNVENYDSALKKLERLANFFDSIEYYPPTNVINYICRQNHVLKKFCQ